MCFAAERPASRSASMLHVSTGYMLKGQITPFPRESSPLRHTVYFLADDDEQVLLSEDTLAFGLPGGYERSSTKLGIPAGRQVRVELRDAGGHLLDRRTYLARVEPGDG